MNRLVIHESIAARCGSIIVGFSLFHGVGVTRMCGAAGGANSSESAGVNFPEVI